MSTPQINRTDVEARYHPQNVARWADLNDDNNSTTIAAAVALAIAEADGTFDDMIRSTATGYTVPVVDSSGNVPASVKACKVRMAGYILSTARDVRDFDKEGKPINNLYADYQWAMMMIDRIRDNKIKFDTIG